MGDGAAHAQIGQFGAAEIELQRIGMDVALIAFCRHVKARVFAKPVDVGNGQRRERAEQQLACLQLCCRGGTIADHFPDHAIQLGAIFPPIGRVAFCDDELPAFILHEPERPGADRRGVRRILADLTGLIDMFGRDEAQIR